MHEDTNCTIYLNPMIFYQQPQTPDSNFYWKSFSISDKLLNKTAFHFPDSVHIQRIQFDM